VKSLSRVVRIRTWLAHAPSKGCTHHRAPAARHANRNTAKHKRLYASAAPRGAIRSRPPVARPSPAEYGGGCTRRLRAAGPHSHPAAAGTVVAGSRRAGG
jgi:hypothetical protein